jgi:putative peptidoglycan lipid II flippase
LTAALAWASWRIDWIGMAAHWGWRVGLMAAVLTGVALLYFGLLALAGLRPRQFMRQG